MKKKSKKREKIQTRIHRRWWPLVHHINTSSLQLHVTHHMSTAACGAEHDFGWLPAARVCSSSLLARLSRSWEAGAQ